MSSRADFFPSDGGRKRLSGGPRERCSRRRHDDIVSAEKNRQVALQSFDRCQRIKIFRAVARLAIDSHLFNCSGQLTFPIAVRLQKPGQSYLTDDWPGPI